MGTPGPQPEVTLEDVLQRFRERDDPAEPLTAREVAEHVGCSRRTALSKLHALEDRGDITSKKVGGRSLVWWIPERSAGTIDADDPFWTVEAGSSGESDVSEHVDDVLYGDGEGA